MKSIREYLIESISVNEGEITDEKSFREAAAAKFKAVYGDDLDEDQMNKIIDGILSKYKDADWGKKIGILNKSFGGG